MDFIDYDLDYPYNNQNPSQSSSSFFPISSPSSSSNDILTAYRCVLLNYPVNSTNSPITYYTLWLLNNNPLYPPSEFTPLHHVVYQISQVVMLLYVLFWSSKGVIGYLILATYFIAQIVWGIVIMKSLDISGWGVLLLSILVCKLTCYVACGRGRSSSTKSPGRSNGTINKSYSSSFMISGSVSKEVCNEVDLIYSRLFAPVRVSYKQFMRVVGCKRGFRVMGAGENYAVEKRSRVDSLGLLVSGRLVVSQGGKALHVILPFQFVDSPEYFGVATDELFQVTITALEESKLLVWHRDKLRLTIMNDEFLRVMFDHIIGRDVVRKLIQVSDTIMTPTTTNYSSSTQSTSTTSSLLPPPPPPTSSSSTPSIITNATASSGPAQIMLTRKDQKYAYQPTYLTSLSEEKTNNGGPVATNNGGNKLNGECNSFDREEEEEDEDDDEDEEQLESVCISGNEKEPMLGGQPVGGVIASGVDADKVNME